MSNDRLKRNQRHIIKRIIIKGTLILDTPTCLSSGDADGSTDMMLVRDSISSHALLTGASIAGALRNYVDEYEHDYGYEHEYEKNEQDNSLSTFLFGGRSKDDDGDQSPLIVDDSISSEVPKTELRDGVKINSVTRTAADKAKYDLELLQAGTEFPLSFELLIEKKEEDRTKQEIYEDKLIQALAIALSGLKQGEISLGMKKRRGFGRCHVEEWQVWHFNLEDPGDRIAWLLFDRECSNKLPVITAKIADALGINLDETEDKRDRFTIHATFKLVGSLLIRSGQDSTGRAPDVVHLKSHRPGKTDAEPVLSGTSLAGVLRHRAERIVNTLNKPTTIIDEMFGPDFSKDKTKQAKASRLVVRETEIEEAKDLVQNRIALDRFTGGAYHGALFDEQPIFGGDKTIVTIELELRKPEKYEIGLLLLLLKDLWTQDLSLGGESSIGRGRLKGIKADLIWNHPENLKTWKISEEAGKLYVTDKGDSSKSEDSESARNEMEGFVKELLTHLGKDVEK